MLRSQQSFCDLEMTADDDYSSCDSLSSPNSDSISSAIASRLSLIDTECPKDKTNCSVNVTDSGSNNVMGRNPASKSSCQVIQEPPDYAWLQGRCDGDTRLVLEVLRCFCEQGEAHLQAMKSAMKEMDTNKLVFHAVNECHPY
jgi:hypothetical protein